MWRDMIISQVGSIVHNYIQTCYPIQKLCDAQYKGEEINLILGKAVQTYYHK